MTSLTIAGLNGAIRIRHVALYGQQYQGLAFVFGQKNWLGRWSFYTADLRLTPGDATVRPCVVTKLP